MKTYTVKLYEGVSREKVNETLKYYPDYFGKISIIRPLGACKLFCVSSIFYK